MEYTHKALIAAGYKRVAPDDRRGQGFVRYDRHGAAPVEVVFVGDSARMEAWTEAHWKNYFPDVYRWYIDLKNREPHSWGGYFIFIKGEDPLLAER